MAWIKFDAARVKRLKKFHDFRKDLNWSVNEALGFLGSFWGEAIEVCESGDVTGWTPEYLSELTGLNGSVGERVWNALGARDWLTKLNGKTLIHDWLDTAGTYLVKRYGGNGVDSAGHQRLVGIWALHGFVYGRDRKLIEKGPDNDRILTLDKTRLDEKRTETKTTPPAVVFEAAPKAAPEEPATAAALDVLDPFGAWYADYPNKTAKAAAVRAWAKLKPSTALQDELRKAVAAQGAWRAACASAGAFAPAWPHPATWLNGRRWEDVLVAPVAAATRPGPAATGAADGPPVGEPYKPATPAQRVVCYYKILKGLAMDDRAWDAAQWGALEPEAARFLAAFDGNDRAATAWLEAWAAPKNAAGKPGWAMAWATRDAWEGKGARAADAPADDRARLRRRVASGAELAGDFLQTTDHFVEENP